MQKIVLHTRDGDQIWVDNAPDGDELTLTLTSKFVATDHVHDAAWGEVRVFRAIEHCEDLISNHGARGVMERRPHPAQTLSFWQHLTRLFRSTPNPPKGEEKPKGQFLG